MLRSWASSQKAKLSASATGLTAQSEEDALAQAMAAAMHIMNDDLEGAEAGLKDGDSSFHRLGRGLIAFLRAALGFEKEVMREAQDRLNEAEAQAGKEQKAVQKDPNAFRSAIYEPGTEHALTYAQCLLMGAVVAVLNESLTEALRGFYNMRKAYMTLSGIVESEERFLSSRPVSRASMNTTASIASSQNLQAAAQNGISATPRQQEDQHEWDIVRKDGDDESDDDNDTFEDAEESKDDMATPMEYQGKTETHGVVKDLSHLNLSNSKAQNPDSSTFTQPGSTTTTPPNTTTNPAPSSPNVQQPTSTPSSRPTTALSTPDPDHFTHPIDIYIHSGANLCFGLLLVMLSMIPPAFSRLLSIVGFRGDRERGLRLLWKASSFPNINGAMAGLVVLVFYNGLIGFCDIIPDTNPSLPPDAPENIEGYPTERLEGLLASLRAAFPKSGLWRLEEARMLAGKKEVQRGISMLEGRLDSPLKQVNALSVFERALQAMYLHRFELCAESFVACIKLNNWSHALYFYLAGSAQVELYRVAIAAGDTAAAKAAADKAESYYSQVEANAGKRKFMAKQMPFEVFCLRKLSKWQERAKEWGVSMVEAVGASPIEEMIYHWNGYKKMNASMLERSLESLAWSETHDPHWSQHSIEEKAILSLLRAATLRALGRYEEARDVLEGEVLGVEKAEFTGGFRDDWTLPVAHYEMAVILWQTRTEVGTTREGNEGNRRNVREALEWVEKVKNWGSYVLDARIGTRVTAAEMTLKKWRERHDR